MDRKDENINDGLTLTGQSDVVQKESDTSPESGDENEGLYQSLSVHKSSYTEYVIPLPEDLEYYERIRPGMVEKIIEWADIEVNLTNDDVRHNHACEREKLKIAEVSTRRAQYMSFFLVVLTLATVVVCAILKQPIAAIVVPLIYGCVNVVIALTGRK